MAKKAVATLHEGNMDGRAYTKVIKMVKSMQMILGGKATLSVYVGKSFVLIKSKLLL